MLYAPDYNCELILQSDALEKGLGIVLAQKKNGEDHPIIYLNRKFSGPEKNYSVNEKDCAAIICGIKNLRTYLDRTRFTIETDHRFLS